MRHELIFNEVNPRMKRTLSSGRRSTPSVRPQSAVWASCRAVVFGLIAVAAAACSSGDSATGGGADAGDQPWLRIKPTWDSIYTGYFGPSGVAGCANGSTCHTTADKSGVIASNFSCTDKAACYASLMGASHLIRSQDVMDPAATPLFSKLRQNTGMGTMPSDSTFVFQSQDIDVLKTWIGNGAKND
jgi:hypothetical protein